MTVHRIAVALCVLTFGLIVWGGHVNTTHSGMAFQDWPTSNGAAMLTYAPSQWFMQGDKFWEHGHRLFASLVGAVTVLLLVVSYRALPKDRRPSRSILIADALIFLVVASSLVNLHAMPAGFLEVVMVLLTACTVFAVVVAMRKRNGERIHWFAQAAFPLVCLQACFGGYTVRNNLPDWTSTTHGMLAEVFFLIVIGIAMLSSRTWRTAGRASVHAGRDIKLLILATWGLTFVQFFLGALTRHTDAWGVSTSFPQWSEEGFLPSSDLFQYAQVVIHFTHRTVAYIVALLVVVQWVVVLKHRTELKQLIGTTSMASVVVLLQIALGAMIVLMARNEIVTTLHVMGGVLLLMLNTITLFNANRLYRFAGSTSVSKTSPSSASSSLVGQGR
ncbi:MAG: COX15/CtaA family protein [bacterium]|nr:COX15/CtaA family protein [bacterium]